MHEVLWAQAVEVFHAALEQPEEQRAAFVEAASGDNPELHREVRKMLEADRSGVSRLSRGVEEAVDEILADLPPEPPFLPPPRIGPYQPKEFLGRGGMGAVWKAERADTGQPVAIKFLLLLPMTEFPEERRRRFAEEIATLARLRHPHIVSFHDAGTLDDRTPWFVMDYVEEYCRGTRFTTFCRLPQHRIEDQLRLFRSVCDAVLYAHRQGTIHRDLKPSNVLVAKDGSPRIVDFGIARRMQDGSQLEAPTIPSLRFISDDYAAPEWKRHGQVGVYTDVYSLGVMLYEILTGRHPFRRAAQASGSLHGESRDLPDDRSPEKPSRAVLPEPNLKRDKLSRAAWSDLDKLCLKAMHSDPLQRYPSVESLIRDLDHYLNDEPLDAQPKMLRYRATKFIRRNRRAVLATAAALTLIVAMTAFFTWRLARERNTAREEAARARHIQDFMTGLLQGGDQEAGPAADLRVTTMIDRGIEQAGELKNEPRAQADLYQTLGLMSQKLGQPQQADSLLQKALDLRLTLAHADPEAIATNRMALALVRSDEGRTQEAKQLARQVMEELDRAGRRNSADKSLLGRAQLTLGTVLLATGEQKEAVLVLERAVASLQPPPGATPPPELARTLAILGDAQFYLGDYTQAESAYRRALDLDYQVYGDTHPHIAEDLADLGEVYEMRGLYAEAEPLGRQALAIMRRWYGSNHPETARKMTKLATTLLYENKNDEADELLRHALTIQERTYGKDHTHVAYVLNSMGLVALNAKRFEEAKENYLRIAAIYRQNYGENDYRVAVALGNLASVYQEEKQYPEAERLMRDAIARFTRALGADNIQTGFTQVRLGRVLRHEQKYVEALEHSLAGYNILKDKTSSTTSYVQGAVQDMAIEYAALGHPDRAPKFEARQTALSTSSSR